MLWQRLRSASWLNWSLAILATAIWLPRLSGDDAVTAKSASRPKAVVLDVSPLPEKTAQPKLAPAEQALDLRFLGPLESDPADEPPRDERSAPKLRIADADAEAEELPPLILKPTTTRDAAQKTPEYVPTTEPDAVVTPPAKQSEVMVPPAPSVGPAVRYWIVSTRCCRQRQHRCGTACRFICHAVAEDCQLHLASIDDVLKSLSPGVPTCIMVHGSFTRMQDVREDSEETYCWLRRACAGAPLNFIYFTWPSEGVFSIIPHLPLTTPVPCLDFAILSQRAEQNGFYLADLIGSVPPSCPISLMGHSLGTRTIVSGLHLLGGGTVHGKARLNPADCGNHIRVVLAAAAIEHDWLNPGARYGCALQRADCLLNLRNECDWAMTLYPLRRPFSSRSLAHSGFTRKDQRELGNHLVQVSELDVTPLIGKSHTWPSYTRRPEIAAAIAPYVFFDFATPSVEKAQTSKPRGSVR